MIMVWSRPFWRNTLSSRQEHLASLGFFLMSIFPIKKREARCSCLPLLWLCSTSAHIYKPITPKNCDLSTMTVCYNIRLIQQIG